MVSLDNARIVSYEDKGKVFEILVDPDLALSVREGHKKFKDVYSNLLAADHIYKDGKKLELVSDKMLLDAFGTTELEDIVTIILEKGRFDLTTEQRRKLYDAKRKEIIDYIIKNSINPITKAPHTIVRIETAMDQARVDIDVQKPILAQIDKIVDKLKPIIPMTFQKSKYILRVPIEQAGRINGFISKYEIVERKWESGFFVCVISIPIGLKDNFIKSIDGLTQGKAYIELLV